MTTLSEKRLAQFQSKIHQQVGISLDNNTDDVETKLDNVIVNTANYHITGGATMINTAGEVLTTPTVDLNINSSLMRVEWVGTTSHSSSIMEILVSNDDSSYFVLNSAVALSTSTQFTISYHSAFRYTKLRITNSHGSSSLTTNFIYSAKE